MMMTVTDDLVDCEDDNDDNDDSEDEDNDDDDDDNDDDGNDTVKPHNWVNPRKVRKVLPEAQNL